MMELSKVRVSSENSSVESNNNKRFPLTPRSISQNSTSRLSILVSEDHSQKVSNSSNSLRVVASYESAPPSVYDHSIRKYYAPSRNIRKKEEKLSIPSHMDKVKSFIMAVRSEEYTDQELEAAKHEIKRGKSLESFEIRKLESLISYLRERAILCASKRNYIEAIETDDIVKYIKQYLNNIVYQHEDNLPAKEAEFERAKEILRDQHREELFRFDEQTREKRMRIGDRHSEEVKNFEEKWRDEMPDKYRKPSAKLLGLFAHERKLALASKYDEADNYARQAEALRNIEMRNAQIALIKDYRIAKNRLFAAHSLEMEKFEDVRLHLRRVILSRQETERDKLRRREEVLEYQANEYTRPLESMLGTENREIPCKVSMTNVRYQLWGERNGVLPPLLAPNDEVVEKSIEKAAKVATKRKKEMIDYLNIKYSSGPYYSPRRGPGGGRSYNFSGELFHLSDPHKDTPKVSRRDYKNSRLSISCNEKENNISNANVIPPNVTDEKKTVTEQNIKVTDKNDRRPSKRGRGSATSSTSRGKDSVRSAIVV